MQDTLKVLSALSCDKRLLVLNWLKDPAQNFPEQIHGDPIQDGVCGLLISKKLEISQPTTSRHMKILLDAGLVRAKRIQQWTYYQRDEAGITRAQQLINSAF